MVWAEPPKRRAGIWLPTMYASTRAAAAPRWPGRGSTGCAIWAPRGRARPCWSARRIVWRAASLSGVGDRRVRAGRLRGRVPQPRLRRQPGAADAAADAGRVRRVRARPDPGPDPTWPSVLGAPRAGELGRHADLRLPPERPGRAGAPAARRRGERSGGGAPAVPLAGRGAAEFLRDPEALDRARGADPPGRRARLGAEHRDPDPVELELQGPRLVQSPARGGPGPAARRDRLQGSPPGRSGQPGLPAGGGVDPGAGARHHRRRALAPGPGAAGPQPRARHTEQHPAPVSAERAADLRPVWPAHDRRHGRGWAAPLRLLGPLPAPRPGRL